MKSCARIQTIQLLFLSVLTLTNCRTTQTAGYEPDGRPDGFPDDNTLIVSGKNPADDEGKRAAGNPTAIEAKAKQDALQDLRFNFEKLCRNQVDHLQEIATCVGGPCYPERARSKLELFNELRRDKSLRVNCVRGSAANFQPHCMARVVFIKNGVRSYCLTD